MMRQGNYNCKVSKTGIEFTPVSDSHEIQLVSNVLVEEIVMLNSHTALLKTKKKNLDRFNGDPV